MSGGGGGGSASSTTLFASPDLMLDELNLELKNNMEYRYGIITKLSLSLPSSLPDDFAAWLVFQADSEGTSMDYPDSIKWSGDDVASNVFTPLKNTLYNIGFWYDGTNVNAVTRGVAI
jgi:hypothetical protein